ncbi:MAG: hypothetical protein KDD22_06070, partial [Bdellovibrionales bacterium]|nr:hypothetical protein [Bdellovibrionales bacterium]
SGGVYRPANYDRNFHGPISVRESLASSLNVPAVKVVLMLGLSETYQTIKGLGFKDMKEPNFYGVSMALGAVDVQLETLANAYRALAQRGEWSELQYVKSKEKNLRSTRQLLSPEATYIVEDILSDPMARVIGFGFNTPLETSFWTAVKTGTSKDYRDNWCVGFSEKYTVAVWAGNFDATKMQDVSGVAGAGPSWYDIMQFLHRSERSHPPLMPEGIVKKDIRLPWNSHLRQEVFMKGTEPKGEELQISEIKDLQFVFPAPNSVLVKNPHLRPDQQALFVRFKGSLPEKAELFLDGESLGPAESPFKLLDPPRGQHRLAVKSEGKVLAEVAFKIR